MMANWIREASSGRGHKCPAVATFCSRKQRTTTWITYRREYPIQITLSTHVICLTATTTHFNPLNFIYFEIPLRTFSCDSQQRLLNLITEAICEWECSNYLRIKCILWMSANKNGNMEFSSFLNKIKIKIINIRIIFPIY